MIKMAIHEDFELDYLASVVIMTLNVFLNNKYTAPNPKVENGILRLNTSDMADN